MGGDERVMNKLPREWSEYLLKQPETGMDYQIVSIELADGSKVEDVAIIHHSIIGEVRGHEDLPFDPEAIVGIQVTHNKWNFSQANKPELTARLQLSALNDEIMSMLHSSQLKADTVDSKIVINWLRVLYDEVQLALGCDAHFFPPNNAGK